MSKDAYISYLLQQAKALEAVANEIKEGMPIESDWLVDWNLKREREYVDAHSRR